MRRIYTSLALLLVGCGPSQSDIENARAEERARFESQRANELAAQNAAQNAIMAHADCVRERDRLATERQNEITRARDNLRTALGFVQNRVSDSSVSFGVRIETVEGNEWRWVEGEDVTSDDGRTRSDLFHYSVSPTALSTNVEVTRVNGGAGIRFSCLAGNCIRVTGRRIQNGSLVDVDEMRGYNYWALDTTNRAEVVRNALSSLIRRANESTPARECPAS